MRQHHSPEKVASKYISICKSYFLLTYHVKVHMCSSRKNRYSKTKQNHTEEGTNFSFLREMRKIIKLLIILLV